MVIGERVPFSQQCEMLVVYRFVFFTFKFDGTVDTCAPFVNGAFDLPNRSLRVSVIERVE